MVVVFDSEAAGWYSEGIMTSKNSRHEDLVSRGQQASQAYVDPVLSHRLNQASLQIAMSGRYSERLSRIEGAKSEDARRAFIGRFYFSDQRCPTCLSFGCDGC